MRLLSRRFRHFLRQLQGVGDELTGKHDKPGLGVWLVAGTAAVAACEMARRQMQGLRKGQLSFQSLAQEMNWIAGVPPTVRLLTRVVGTERAGIMVAWITVIHQIGGAAAAYLGGVLRISFGSYFEAFLLAGLLCISAATMALLIGAGGQRARPERAVLAAE